MLIHAFYVAKPNVVFLASTRAGAIQRRNKINLNKLRRVEAINR